MKKVSMILCIIVLISVMAIPAMAEWNAHLNQYNNWTINYEYQSSGGILKADNTYFALLSLNIGGKIDSIDSGYMVSVAWPTVALRNHKAVSSHDATLDVFG